MTTPVVVTERDVPLLSFLAMMPSLPALTLYYGIEARNYGSGDLIVMSTNADGTASVTGGVAGILAYNTNGGALSVTADSVTGTANDGINATNDAAGTSLSVTTYGTVTGANQGIYAYNDGTGDLSITATNMDGTASVLGADIGIYANNENGGALSVTADTVTGTTNDAIAVTNQAGGTSLTIRTRTVTGANIGIAGVNRGTGDLVVDASTPEGTGDVYGGTYGIFAVNENGGALNVTADNVEGFTNNGIDARNEIGGTALSVTTKGSVLASGYGIYARNDGTGDLTVMSSGTVTGDRSAMFLSNLSGGALDVTAGNVTSTGSAAIYAINDAYGTDLSIVTTGTVSAATTGIYAKHYGTGTLSVTISGQTSGTVGISTETTAGGMSVITLNDGANLSGTGYALINDAGDSTTYLNDGATLSGAVQLGDGSDNLTIAGADITGATTLDGGDDTDSTDGFIDILAFDGFSGSLSAAFLNWEDVSFDNSDVTFTGASLSTPTTRLENGTTLRPSQTGFVFNTDLGIDPTSRFEAGLSGMGRVTINGNVANSGTLSLIDNAAGDELHISGDLTGAGSVGLDVDVTTATTDRLVIEGDAVDQGTLDINGFGTTTTAEALTLVEVEGATSATAFSLGSANMVLPEGETAQVIGAFTYTLGFDADANTFVLNPFDDGGTMRGNPTIPLFEAYPALLTALNMPGATFQTWGNRSGADQGAVAQAMFDFAPAPNNAIWFSFTGSQSEYEGQSTTAATVDTEGSRFEMGLDLPVYEGQRGRLLMGGSFALHEASTDIAAPLTTAAIDTDGQSFTLSALWLTDSLFYANGQLRYSTFSSDMTLAGIGPVALGAQGEGVAMSIEVGQAFALSDRLTLVPQAQIIHSDVRGDGIADPFGTPGLSTITDGATTSARLGLHAERVTGRVSLFGAISYIHAFDADTSVQFAGQTFTTRLDDNRIELRAGGQITVGENSLLYGGLTYQGGLSDLDGDRSYSLTGGVRVNF
ncbi:MAG: autotransporter outer membrane beta-barrel domain-containing protein [Pseudomonadota bacterium]